MVRRTLALALSVALAFSSAARAETPDNPETTADLRCIAVAFAMTADDQFKAVGMMVMLYYLGRLDGREPDLDLAKKFSNPEGMLAGQSLQDAAKSCGEKMTARGKALKDIGAGMIDAEKAAKATKGT